MDDKLDFISSIGKIAFFLMLILSIFLFTVKSTKRISNQLFAILLLLIAFDLTGFFVGDWISQNPHFDILKTASSLLQMPLFFLYVVSICYTDFKLRSKHGIHTLLFVLFLIIFHLISFSVASIRIFEVIIEIQWFAYMIAVFIILEKHKKIYQENYSQPKPKLYTWLFQFVILSCIGHSFVLLRWFISFSGLNEVILNLNIVISISTLLIITWFVFKALYQPELFSGIQTELKTVKTLVIKKNDSSSNILEQDIKRIQSFMEREKPYLNFDLTLQKLANQLKMPEKELSLLINHHIGKHFFDFINEYRIEHAKKVLSNPGEEDQTILEILYQVGFNSKSSFYTAFKKITGQTPTRYRKEKLSH